MVTPVGPVLPGGPAQAAEPVNSDKTNRSISEARRVLTQNRVTGAKAMRVVNMLSQAEQSMAGGKSVDAQRLAREALKLAQEESEQAAPIDPASEESSEETAAQDPLNEENADTPASEALGVDPNQPFERESTSYADASGDSGVSFQYAQPLTQGQAPFAVRQHEMSHVRRETSEAILNGQRVMSSITIRSRIDPNTGQRHIGGGRARVIIFPDIKLNHSTGNNLDETG